MKSILKKGMQLRVVSLALGVLFAMGTEAQAQSINGSITFDGSANIEDASGIALSSDLTTAAILDFNTAPNYQEAVFGLGDFSSYVGMFDIATFQNFSFKPALSPNPTDPLWTVGGFNFELTSIVVDPLSGADLLHLYGRGILTGNGFDPTLGTFDFTTQSGDGSTSVLSISASSSNVPVPAAIFFVAPVLAGLFGFSRSRHGVKASV